MLLGISEVYYFYCCIKRITVYLLFINWWILFLVFGYYKVAVNIRIQVFLWAHDFISLGQIPMSENAGLCCKRNCQTVSQRCSSIFHSHQQCEFKFLHSQCWVLSVLLILAILIVYSAASLLVLIWIFIMTGDVEHLYMCTFSLLMPIEIFCSFYPLSVLSLSWSCKSSFYSLATSLC